MSLECRVAWPAGRLVVRQARRWRPALPGRARASRAIRSTATIAATYTSTKSFLLARIQQKYSARGAIT